MQKKILQSFVGPLFRPQKIQGPLFAMKIMGQPHRKACKLYFHCKIFVIFFQGPLTRLKNLKGPFLYQAPKQVFVNGP